MMPTALSDADAQRVVAAIAAAERGNRGELRVHLERRCPKDPLERAGELFAQLGMRATRHDTGVLLYVAPEDRKAAVYAGAGIRAEVAPDTWQAALDAVIAGYAAGRGVEGLVHGVGLLGEAMRQAAPGEDTEGDELPDAVTTS